MDIASDVATDIAMTNITCHASQPSHDVHDLPSGSPSFYRKLSDIAVSKSLPKKSRRRGRKHQNNTSISSLGARGSSPRFWDQGAAMFHVSTDNIFATPSPTKQQSTKSKRRRKGIKSNRRQMTDFNGNLKSLSLIKAAAAREPEQCHSLLSLAALADYFQYTAS